MAIDQSTTPVIKAVTYFLGHVPSMIRHGSKPSRDILANPALLAEVLGHLNSFEKAVAYPPNQTFIGNLDPERLLDMPSPWYQNDMPDASRWGAFGEIMPEEEFYGVLKICDDFDLLLLEEAFLNDSKNRLESHPLITNADLRKLENKGTPIEQIQGAIEDEKALPLYIDGDQLIGCCRRGHAEDFNLTPDIIIENLTNRASGVIALRHLTNKFGDAKTLDYLIGCGEEAVGDRYNRGGGNMAKAIGELSGCINATGSDTKAFCCAPIHAIIIGASLVKSNLFQNVAIIAGGSFAKLGMKYHGHLRSDMPILEDVMAGIAIWIGQDDGQSPVIRLDSIGKHSINSGSSQQAILENLVSEPLDRLGLKMTEIDKFATELHNPELTEPQGSGNVPRTNYRLIGSMAVMRREIKRNELEDFVRIHGMPGFSPTQGHIASAVPALGHVAQKMRAGKMDKSLFLAKGSLFLGRMTQLSDGISFLLEKNNGVT